jgi:inhibitor of cysteine peptidase
VKKLLILMLIAVALTIAGCIGVAETYTDPGQTVNIGPNQELVIALGSNPSTGYSWQESHDHTMLELLEKVYREEAEEGVVGAGGVEYFRFKALKAGQTEITMTYQRPWEEEILEQKVFSVYIR